MASSTGDAGRSAPRGAVFLSYASQDTEAAKKIADALRAAGVEVWFDQNELVGGDAWDQKIRKQIGECALFLPVISANTQARGEGYFRIEWRLAAQRTHAMADDETFLIPVVIDTTGDAEARVPAEFKTVQWTRLPGGQATPAFGTRVARLLQGGRDEDRVRPVASAGSAPARRSLLPWKWLGVGLAALALAYLGVRTLRQSRGAEAVAPVAAAAPTEARKLAAQALQLLQEPNLTRESSWLADELCEKALRLDASDAEAWAVASLASLNLYTNIYDTSAARKEKARMQGERARQLDPQSVHAGLAVARYQLQFGTKDEAWTMLQNLHARAAEDPQVIFSLIEAARQRDDDQAVAGYFAKLRALPRSGVLAQALWFEAVRLRGRGRFAEAERLLDEVLADMGPLRGALYEKLLLVTSGWHELSEGEAIIARLPERFRQEPAFASELAQYWLMRGNASEALEALGQVPQEYLEEFMAREPKALLAGWAHALAARPAAAKAEWQSALAVVEAKLKDDPRNIALLHQRVLLLGLTGQTDAAKAAWQPLGELSIGRASIGTGNAVQILSVLGETGVAIDTVERLWPTLEAGQKARLLTQLSHHPAYLPLRDLPRVRAVREEGERWLRGLKTAATPKGLAAGATSTDEKSVAVLAFANLSDDKANEYFSDGISEELLNVLAKVPGLTVRGRSSGFYFKGKQIKAVEIGQQLNVSYLVQGSVRRAGDRVRISAQLIRAATDEVVWSSGPLDRDVRDIFAVQDEIAGVIAKNLSMSMGVTARAAHQVNPEALTALLQGRQFWVLRTMEGFARAGELFKRAVALDPDWAPAHAALANLITIEASYRKGAGESVGEQFVHAAQAAKRAIELDPTLGEPHAALGKIAMEDLRFAEAGEEFRRALELEPNNALVRDWYGDLMVTVGRLDQAIAEYQRAAEIEPLSPYILWDLAWELMHVRRYGEALALLDRATTLTPNGAARLTVRRARLLLQLGRKAEAEAALRPFLEGFANDPDPQMTNEVVWCLPLLGATPDRERWTAALLRQSPGSFSSGVILLALGQEEKAIPLLEKCPPIFWQQLYWDPLFDPVRGTRWFHQVLEMLGCSVHYKVARESLARLIPEKPASP